MIKTLRTRLLIGLTPLLTIMVGLGLWAIVMFYRLGGNIDVILRENYRSVVAAQNMIDSVERMDSAFLLAIGGRTARAQEQFDVAHERFRKNLVVEQHNITLPGEQEMADRLAVYFQEYSKLAARFFALEPEPAAARSDLYFGELLPTFHRIKDEAQRVLEINQRNMEDMDRQARRAAAVSVRLMVVSLLASVVVATLLAVVLSRSILEPIHAVTRGARAMARGDLDQVVPSLTHDELGELATAFNAMARTIREFRQAGTARLLRAQKTAQATIDSFPDPVVLVDPTGSVERANPAARRILHVAPSAESATPWTPSSQLQGALAEVLRGRPDYLPTGVENAICLRDEGQERFYLPRVLAIRGDGDDLLGAAVVLQDVTKFRLVDQLKSDMVSTVSHELKTPLTSVQMAVHLLLEEAVGPLTPKQVELLMAARQDSDRLLAMINDLLDLTRIEQGRLRLDLKPVASADLVGAAMERFSTSAEDSGVALKAEVAFGLPPVLVDQERVSHVFDNLIGNALAHTKRGGAVAINAKRQGTLVEFSVTDTGQGIPTDHLERVFERFYRVPGSRSREGAGLGLAIAREVVLAHGGEIGVASEPGRGTTFRFTIPVATEDGHVAHNAEAQPWPTAATS